VKRKRHAGSVSLENRLAAARLPPPLHARCV